MQQIHIYALQVLFVAGITYSSKSLDMNNKDQWLISVARYVMYMITIQTTKATSSLIYDIALKRRTIDIKLFSKVNSTQLVFYTASVLVLYTNEQKWFTQEFPLIFIAYLIVKCPEIAQSGKAIVTYGTGMACSFIEGYLVLVLPSDGGQRNPTGFLGNIKTFEAKQGVVFPVKRMFLIITKSMFCPPDLAEFNDNTGKTGLCTLEACKSLEEVVKDVAGVKERSYKSSAYKIIRPDRRPPVYITAECATPIHTLYRVIKNRDLYDKLADVDKDDIIADFISMLRSVLTKSPELKNKCEIVFFDDTNPDLNLADVLLDRIRELEPNFEELVSQRN